MAEDEGCWRSQVEEFCRMFGFELKEKPMRSYSGGLGDRAAEYINMVYLMRGRAYVFRLDERRKEIAVRAPIDGARRNAEEKAMADVMRQLSGAELVVRRTAGRVPSPLGYTTVSEARHIRLPEFSSVGELRLKLVAAGEEGLC